MVIKGKPDISEFLDGASSERPQPASPSDSSTIPESIMIEITAPVPTIQKIFRLRWDVATALKAHAAKETAATGKRVTETEIVESLLKKHLKILR